LRAVADRTASARQPDATLIAAATRAPRHPYQRASALREAHQFRYPLARLLSKRVEQDNAAQGELLTGDFAWGICFDMVAPRGRS
jgi:hypothetical protein